MEITQEMAEPSTHEVLGGATANPSTLRGGYTVPALGKQYPVASLENRIIGQFEQYAEGRTLQHIYELAKTNSAEADAQRSVFHSDKLAGSYSWDIFSTGKHLLALRGSPRGFLYLLYLLMRRCNDKITELEVKRVAVDNMQGCLNALRWAQGNWESREKEALGMKDEEVSNDNHKETNTSQ